MDKIIIAEEHYGRKQNHFEDDDLIDRFNNRYTVMGLVMCIFIITGTQYVGKPINCWTPAEFKGQHDGYANINIPDRSKPRVYYVSYYQWTPFIILGMAMFFLLPKFIWHVFTRKGGFNIRRLVQTIKDKPDAEKGVDFVKRTLKAYIETQNKLHGSVCCGVRCHNWYVSYTLTYFIVKILYTINTLAQFFLLNSFLSFHFTGYGVEALDKLFHSQHWIESPRFPLVTMCDFMVRRLGSNQHWYAIQCTLPINMYNEKIFLGIWLWLIVLTILNIISIITWITSLTTSRRLTTVKRYLKVAQNISSETNQLLLSRTSRSEDFSEFIGYLHADGFLIFNIIAQNTDEMVAGQIIEHLYRTYETSTMHSNNDV
ncbi:unnamed protein product [Adineta steineri]|uniref:Innexin n=1 Tax=Adineta steineri TaxID=433720 RepID=A0A818H3Y1_9BILA|nr:unnamed protein product [Adineta steineri]CAF3498073.1 unnamed protein product [Adineta steineri]CAF3547335.1 unnamed protein product [Adineta steineri]